MKNAKRGLAVFIALILLTGMTAYAEVYEHFPDVPSDAEYADAVNALADIGIFSGDDKGNFNPDKTMTRAEFATVMVRLLGEADRAQSVTTSSFDDVPSTHWACGYISVAVELGLVSGYGGGKFGPGDTLTYEQAVTVLVRVLGYDEEAVNAGGWPDGYIEVANDLGITEGTSTSMGIPVKRSIIALLLANMLSTPHKDYHGN